MEVSSVRSSSSPSTSCVLKENKVSDTSYKRKVQVLSEEEYTEKMEKIITRDFFPDLPKLKAQNEYLDAIERGDMAKLHEIQMNFRPTIGGSSRANSVRGSFFSTPATFDTPDISVQNSPHILPVNEDVSNSTPSEKGKNEKSLDQFLAGTTSEDNASFETIMQKSAVRHQLKFPWLYKDEEAEAKKIADMLTLPSSEKQAIEDKSSGKLVTWAYTNKNALMYVPDGKELNIKEKLQNENQEKVEHVNTRFITPPFDEQANKEAIAEAASIQAKLKEGKVGIDGKEIIPGESPEVNGYGFVATPLPAPGVSDTPIMTWGEIEGTPFRLDGSDTPLPQNPNGQQFKISNLSARERIALSLADKAAKKHRKPSSVRKTQTTFLSPSPLFGLSGSLTPLERLQTMTPAAQKLACAKLGIQRDTDRALRASYSPSPLHITPRDRTPCSIKTPGSITPQNWQQNKPTVITPSHAESMMNQSKRSKAKDFF